MTADTARTECAVSSQSRSHFGNACARRGTGRHRCPSTSASARKPSLVVNRGMSLDRARELVRAELFPEDLDPWAGDEQYGPLS